MGTWKMGEAARGMEDCFEGSDRRQEVTTAMLVCCGHVYPDATVTRHADHTKAALIELTFCANKQHTQ